jgi:hypothetical protein
LLEKGGHASIDEAGPIARRPSDVVIEAMAHASNVHDPSESESPFERAHRTEPRVARSHHGERVNASLG